MEFFYISNIEMDFIVGIVSRNLASQSNFIEFRDYQSFVFFEKKTVESGYECPRGPRW